MSNKPCRQAAFYFGNHQTPTTTEMTREEFNKLVEDGFKDGPWMETFGDGYGEPYNPHRQAYGVTKDGRGVYAQVR